MKILLLILTLAFFAVGITLFYFRNLNARAAMGKPSKKKLNPHSIFGCLSLITAAVFATSLCAEFFPIEMQQSWLYATIIYVVLYLLSKEIAESIAQRRK